MARKTKDDLYDALEENDMEAVRKCIEAGVSVNAKHEWRSSPLHCAVATGNLEMVKYLVEQGAHLHTPDDDSRTPRMYAEYMDYERISDFLKATERAQNMPEWTLLGSENVVRTGISAHLDRQITEIFNFSSRERTVILENTRLEKETTFAPVSFDELPTPLIEGALTAFKKLGGKTDEEYAINGTARLAGKPRTSLSQ